MPYVPLLVYVHILLMVFWIGTDVGVFVAGLRFMDPKRSLEERNAVISLGMVIDRYPRICFVLIVPVGLQLSAVLGLVPLSTRMMACVWIFSAGWLGTVVACMRRVGTRQGRKWQRLERCFLIIGLLLCTVVGTAGWTGRLLMPGWLAFKILAYGAMCLFALLLDRAFAHVFIAFAPINAERSTPQRAALLRTAMIRTYVWVVAIYAAVLVSGFLGTVKP